MCITNVITNVIAGDVSKSSDFPAASFTLATSAVVVIAATSPGFPAAVKSYVTAPLASLVAVSVKSSVAAAMFSACLAVTLPVISAELAPAVMVKAVSVNPDTASESIFTNEIDIV